MNDYLYRLSKTVSHALRHVPEEYGLSLDKDGWVTVNELIFSLKNKNITCKDLKEEELIEMINQSSKKRHEIKGNKIRALYGHSTEKKIIKEMKSPPEYLYHGTSPESINVILSEGLKSMSRHYVHLSTDQETAKQVGGRRNSRPIIFKIRAKEASEQGINFYMGNENIWLADYIPPTYIDLIL